LLFGLKHYSIYTEQACVEWVTREDKNVLFIRVSCPMQSSLPGSSQKIF